MSRKNEVVEEVRERNQEYSVEKKYRTVFTEEAGRKPKGTRKRRKKRALVGWLRWLEPRPVHQKVSDSIHLSRL